MGLSIGQQGRATKAYVLHHLKNSEDRSEILKDPDFLRRLDLNLGTIFAIFAELYGFYFDCLDQSTELLLMCGRSWKGRLKDSGFLGMDLCSSQKKRRIWCQGMQVN